ncbi:MAG: endonuclease/exonuclease/phosphatase family protein [Polyangiaceae bacterium]|nr:endonuclease/exonuclease/phosphatase family protein [Polyangiaceae bacterium]
MVASPRGASTAFLSLTLLLVSCSDSEGPQGGGGSGGQAQTTSTGGAGGTGGNPTSAGGSAGAETGGQGGMVVTGGGGAGGGGANTGGGGAAGGEGGSGGAGGDGGSGGSGGDGGAGGAEPQGTRVRLVAANLTSGNNQSYDPGHGIRILQGIDPDIIFVQEFKYQDSDTTDLTTFVTNVCGASCQYVRGPAAEIPNGVISRYPILASGSWVDDEVSNRTFVWARIDVPGPTDLWAISVHLLTSSATDRNQEAQALVDLIETNIPAGDYVALGGDFNTDVRTEMAISTFDPIFVTTAPFPADQAGNEFTNTNRSKPYDWVLADDDLSPLATSVTIGQTTFPNGAVIDTRVYSPLADISPAQLNDSGAPSMQHMAVVRDFAFPE